MFGNKSHILKEFADYGYCQVSFLSHQISISLQYRRGVKFLIVCTYNNDLSVETHDYGRNQPVDINNTIPMLSQYYKDNGFYSSVLDEDEGESSSSDVPSHYSYVSANSDTASQNQSA